MDVGATTWLLVLPAWLLVAARLTGVVLATPVLSNAGVPVNVRALLVAALSAMMLPAALPGLRLDWSLGQAVVGMMGELLIGAVLGMAASTVMLASQLAGHMVAQQAGLSIGEVFNPTLESEATTLQELWYYVALAAFIAVGGLRRCFEILLGSFATLPPLTIFSRGSDSGDAIGEAAIGLIDLSTRLALQLAGPTMLALLLSTLAMGFLVKTMPQFNVLTVGFTVKAVLGLFMVAATMSGTGDIMSDAVGDSFEHVTALLDSLAAGARHAG